MSVPTHNLYDFIHQTTESKFCVLYFYPFGTKNPNNILNQEWSHSNINKIPRQNLIASKIYNDVLDINDLNHAYRSWLQPTILCNDQEPLFFEYYQNKDLYGEVNPAQFYPVSNFNIRWAWPHNIQKYWILLHSEKNSNELRKYEDTNHFVGAYYWSHALLSLDWFRYAEFDQSIKYNNNNHKHFLIYSRDSTGSRQYRKLFGTFLDPELTVKSQVGSFHPKKTDASLSAEYDTFDINNTDFSVILETVFDDRVHLTEKTCRALATGHPFFLAAGPFSLQLLRDYGFKTFSPWIDESYDTEMNSTERLKKIIQSMKTFTNLSLDKKNQVIGECRKVAKYNKDYFFSNKFFSIIVQELRYNVEQAYAKVNEDMFDVDRFYRNLRWKADHNCKPNLSDEWNKLRYKTDLHFFNYLKNGGTLNDYVPPDLD